MGVLESIIEAINFIDGLVWGLPAVIILAGTGLSIAILGRLFQVTKFKAVLKNMLYKGTGGKGEVSPFATWAAVMGATVGVGNIAGVSTAVHLGGAGALFWMWVCAILGMGTKAVEATLGAWSRRITPDGKVEGGTPYYIRLVPTVGPALAVLFSIFAFIAAYGIGNTVQANNVALGVEYIAKAYGFDVFQAKLITGILMFIFTAIVVLGGVRRIADVSNFLVPFMATWYIVASLVIWIKYGSNLPLAFREIFTYAFTPQAAAGGLSGWLVYSAIRYGFARGLFSNEAGLGSAPNMYAYMSVDHPGRVGLYGIFEVFMDTIVICSMTGIVDIVTRVYIERPDLSGAQLAMEAFYRTYGIWAPVVLGLALALFAYTTLLTWEWYGEVNWIYFWGKTLKLPEKPMRWIWRFMWVIPIIPAAIAETKMFEVFWNFADTANGLMAIPNLIAVAYFAPVGIGLIRDFLRSGKI
ncbi:Sodium:alanine symporter [Desulfurococcus amylolyticus 1221n]|uniref:Sodium:alanine symporter n=1 Tax=Desulfurococcus amylolyticus (strain DSM 18924 / JCM 16383 / VKM B-2413 / 1221n) TaxID=490899 RepID=B8D6H7_DESA1|nr:amino acid carrier protein [Desulfurococcus amylolyticus]ACL11708.1 Sodium:alanine symporter [Desulfurococcus amylolyticus 1221n]